MGSVEEWAHLYSVCVFMSEYASSVSQLLSLIVPLAVIMAEVVD
jgi:hypothetical protein